MREQIATGEIWGAIELSEFDIPITRLFVLSKKIEAAGMGVSYGIDYAVVKDWCEKYDEDSIEMFEILKSMAAVLNEKK